MVPTSARRSNGEELDDVEIDAATTAYDFETLLNIVEDMERR